MMRALLIQLPSGPVQLIGLPSARIVSDPKRLGISRRREGDLCSFT
jgi:hypothetical protein